MPTTNPPELRRQTTAKIYVKPTGSTELINLGDVSNWKLVQDIKRTPVMDSEKGYRLKTGEKLSEIGWTYDATFNEMTQEVLELINLGTAGSAVTQALITAPTGTASFSGVKFRRALKLGKEKVTSVVVKNAANTVTHVLDTDYILDEGSGIIEIKPGGAITEGLTINVTFGCAATSRSKILTLTKLSTYGAVEVHVFDTHADNQIEIHTFDSQYFVTDPGQNDGSKILEVGMRFIATNKPSVTVRA